MISPPPPSLRRSCLETAGKHSENALAVLLAHPFLGESEDVLLWHRFHRPQTTQSVDAAAHLKDLQSPHHQRTTTEANKAKSTEQCVLRSSDALWYHSCFVMLACLDRLWLLPLTGCSDFGFIVEIMDQIRMCVQNTIREMHKSST